MNRTQCEVLLHHLKRGSSITSMAAFRLFDITRLPDRMRDLRKRGINVQSEMIKLASGKRVARYWL
jgi:hypothetical protein